MSQGISTLIRAPAEVGGRLAVVSTDVLALIDRGPVLVTVAQALGKRSLDQNAMFRGLCRDVADWWNANREEPTTAEAVARDLKVQYGVITTEYSPVTGKRSARLKSTAEYSKAEMASLITATLAWAAGEGIPLPDPRGDA
jgi:hypothetical protein